MNRLKGPQNLLGPTAHNRHVAQPQQFDDLLKEIRPPQQGLQQGDLEVRTHQCERNTREARAGAHIADRDALGHDLGEHGTVQQMPLPKPRHLTWTDQSPFHSGIRQQFRVPDSLREELAENRLRAFRRLGKLYFRRHGNRPSIPHYRTVGG